MAVAKVNRKVSVVAVVTETDVIVPTVAAVADVAINNLRINTRSATHLPAIMSSHPVAYFLFEHLWNPAVKEATCDR